MYDELMERQITSSSLMAHPFKTRLTDRMLAGSGLAASLLSMSCCILPLILVSIGVGGAWMGNLTALSPYQPYFLGIAAIIIGFGFWRAYRRPAACAPGSLCELPATGRVTKALLWLGAVSAASALGVDLFGRYFV